MIPLPALDIVGLAILLVFLPVLSMLQVRELRGLEIRRLPVYASSALTLLLLSAACLALGLRRGEGAASMGLAPPPPASLALWTLGVTGAGLGLMFAFHALARALRLEESALLLELLPRTRGERWAFAGLSVAAGLGEEVAYRAYAIPLVAVLSGPATAVVVTAATFGVMHVYQGVLGIVRTAVLGGLLGWAFLASGSLWPVVLAHAALDVLAGIVFADRLVGPRTGVDPTG